MNVYWVYSRWTQLSAAVSMVEFYTSVTAIWEDIINIHCAIGHIRFIVSIVVAIL